MSVILELGRNRFLESLVVAILPANAPRENSLALARTVSWSVDILVDAHLRDVYDFAFLRKATDRLDCSRFPFVPKHPWFSE